MNFPNAPLTTPVSHPVRKEARVRVSMELLRQMFKFPDDTRIVTILDEGRCDERALIVEGEGLPDCFLIGPEGMVNYAKPSYRVEFPSERITLENWG